MKTKLVTTILMMMFLASMLSMAFVAPVKATPDSDIVGLWHFDEGTGSTAYDSSGYDNDGTLSGGKFGNALKFDGTDDYVDVGNIGVTGDWTVEFWAKLDTVTPIIQYPIGTGPGELYGAGIFVAFAWEGDKWGVYDGASYILGSGVSADVWYHVAVSKSGTTFTLYLNGNYENSGTLADVDITNLQIGRRIDPTRGVWYFDGIIDEVRISNIARTTFVLAVAPSVDANTVALWRFDESVGNIAYDSSGNGNDGTIHEATWAGPNWTTEGKFDGALEFDGVDDYVEVLSTSAIMPATLTVEAWVKPSKTGARQGLVSKWDGWVDASYSLELTSDNRFLFYLHNGAATESIKGTTVITTGTWYHVAATYDGINARLYVNGILEAGPTALVSPMTTSSVPLRIGASARGSPYPLYTPYGGVIDEAHIYNTALSADMIQMHAQGFYECTIDIKPCSDPNSINLGDQGVLTVAIMGSADLDVTNIKPDTVKIGDVEIATRGKADKTACSIEDVDGDGYTDFVAKFNVQDLTNAALTELTTKLVLTAELCEGPGIFGSDSVRVVPP